MLAKALGQANDKISGVPHFQGNRSAQAQQKRLSLVPESELWALDR